MATKYRIKYNNGAVYGNVFNSLDKVQQHLMNNGYAFIEVGGTKFWATLDFDKNTFYDEQIEILEEEDLTNKEATEKIFTLLNNNSKELYGCQNFITIKFGNQTFRMTVQEVKLK